MHQRLALVVAMVALLAGCGGGGGSGGSASVPSPAQPGQGGGGLATLTVRLPGSTPATRSRAPKAIVPQTAGIVIAVTPTGGTAVTTAASLAAGSANCTSNSDGSRNCSVAMNVPPGPATIVVTTYDQPPTAAGAPAGNALGTTTIQATLTASQANVVSITPDGIPVKVAIALQNGTLVSGQAGSTTLQVTAYDADGNVIVAPGGYNPGIAISATDGASAFTFSPATLTAPGPVTVNYNGAALPYATIVAAIVGAPSTKVQTQLRFANTIGFADGLQRVFATTQTTQTISSNGASAPQSTPTPVAQTDSFTQTTTGNVTFNGVSGLTQFHSVFPTFLTTNNGSGTTPPVLPATRSQDGYSMLASSGTRVQQVDLFGAVVTIDPRQTTTTVSSYGPNGVGGIGQLIYPFVDGETQTYSPWALNSTTTQVVNPGFTKALGSGFSDAYQQNADGSYVEIFTTTGVSAERYALNSNGSWTYIFVPLAPNGGPPYQVTASAPSGGTVTASVGTPANYPAGMPSPAPGPYDTAAPAPMTTTLPALANPYPQPLAAPYTVTVQANQAMDPSCNLPATVASSKVTASYQYFDSAYSQTGTLTESDYYVRGAGLACLVRTTDYKYFDTGVILGDAYFGGGTFYKPARTVPLQETITRYQRVLTAESFAQARRRAASESGPEAMLPESPASIREQFRTSALQGRAAAVAARRTARGFTR